MSAAEIEVFEKDADPERTSGSIFGVAIGTLIGFSNEGRTPLVILPDQIGTAAIAAASILDLHGPHIGKRVVMQFERGDPQRPIILGLLREGDGWPLPNPPAQVEVDVDGERMLVSAKEQLVLKCGKASITLTKSGKVLLRGAYVSIYSAGINRIKGASIQLN